MTTIDTILIVALAGFVLSGLWFGIIHMIGSMVGLILGAFAAGHYYPQVADLIAPIVGGNMNLAKLLAFFGLFVLVNRLIGLLFHFVEKVFNVIAIIPFLKTFNRLLGAALGLVEGTLVLGLVVYFAGKFPYSTAFEQVLVDSSVARGFNLVGTLLAPLLPEAVRAIKSVFAA